MERLGHYDLEERLIAFALLVIEICEQLPKNYTGQHFSKQLVRSGTSPAFHFEEACGAESRKDFIHKMKVGLKELRESSICLKIINRKSFLEDEEVTYAIKECNELISIFTASVKTARRNMRKGKEY